MAAIFTLTLITLPVLDWRWMLGLASYVRPLALFPIFLGLAMYGATIKSETRLPASKPFLLFLSFFGWALVSTIIMIALAPGVGILKGWTAEAKATREFLALALGVCLFQPNDFHS
jgi:hypothetical protein